MCIIVVNNNTINSITNYRDYAIQNPHLKLPIRTENSYSKYDWKC